MLSPETPLALYMEGALGERVGKMGYGVLRYSPNPVSCIVDSRYAGSNLSEVFPTFQPVFRSPIPIVGDVKEAWDLGARTLVLGIAPGGGRIPTEWLPALDESVGLGMGLVNGLHERLAPRYPNTDGIWDLRQEPEGLQPGQGLARELTNTRILMVGTDMAVGKMTAGLEILRMAKKQGLQTSFVATGQIGIVICGSGVPLDAIRVDYASGAIEREVLAHKSSEWVIIEGQGALNHPGSTSPLPLLRGSCPTHLVLCCRAGQTSLYRMSEIIIPPLSELMRLYSDLSSACGTFPRAEVAAIAVNTAHIESDDEARSAVAHIERETGRPASDPVRFGAAPLVQGIQDAS
ncbi:MAG: DUF1611 domain-containing protein [Fimbriimonadaceae bacterium]